MGRDLRGRASFTRSTVTDTVARLSRPLDRLSLSLSILQATCTYMCVHIYTEYVYIHPPGSVHHLRYALFVWHRRYETGQRLCPRNDTSREGEEICFFS